MLKKITTVFLCFLMAFGVLTACGPQNDISSGVGKNDFPVTIGDVTINEEPKGAAVLSPNIADVILSLEYEITLKAKSADCTQSDLEVLPNVTADDAKKIKDFGANLVFTENKLTDEQLSAFNKEGITVITIKRATSREDLDRLYSEVGSALKGAKTGYERGIKISQGIFLTIDDIGRIVPKSDKPVTVVYLFDENGKAATGDTLEGKLIESAGLVNAVSDSKDNKITYESLKLANPKYIFCPTGLKAKLAASEKYKNLTAVKEGKVFEMNPSLMVLQGRSMVDAVSFMAGKVYPQLLEGTEAPKAPESKSPANSSPANSVPQSKAPTSSKPAESSSPTVENTNITLKLGDKGEEVKKMQNRLKELGYLFVSVSGTYNEGTQQCVKDFQLLNGFQTTGVADPKTLEKLYSSTAVPRTKQ